MPQKASSFELRLIARRTLSPSVCELTLERTDGPLDFEPGQWINLLIPQDGEVLKRAYSIASPPRGDRAIQLAVTRVDGGPASAYLHDMPVGAIVAAVGPQGLFTRASHAKTPALFVATGTGLTPLRSMLHAAIDASSDVPLWILFGVRHEEDIIYRDELEELAGKHANVRFEVTLSQPADGWTGRTGYVQSHVPELFSALAEASSQPVNTYICGLQRMVKAVRNVVRNDLGAERGTVHQERFD